MVKKQAENFAIEFVPLVDLARVLGSSPENIRAIAEQKDALMERWDGSAAVRSDVAREMRLAREVEERREFELRMKHDAWLRDRAARRQALMRETREDMVAPDLVTPAFSAAVRAAQQQALAKFDEREPELGFYEWKDRKPSMTGAR
jgi:hypothetical protein